MAAFPLHLIFLVLSISIVHGRILTLHSSDDHLISDGVHDVHVGNQPSSSAVLSGGAYGAPSIASACDHQYGFLPCAENVPGYIFQIAVYQGLLIWGEKQIGKGSKVLFSILSAGKFGGIIFRILMALPSMMLMIVSGVFSSKENAQNQVSLGVGIYAGITVFSLTVQWGICVIFARRQLAQKPNDQAEASQANNLPAKDQAQASQSNCLPEAKEKLLILKDSGVEVDKPTRVAGGILLLSLIPYITVWMVDIFNTATETRTVTLIALIVSALSLISYFAYQILDPLVQQRSLDYSKYEILRTGFLQHIGKQGQLLNEDGSLNSDVVKRLFKDTNEDSDKGLRKAELEKLVVDMIKNNGEKNIDQQYAVNELMQKFDNNDDKCITEEEFIQGCKKWIEETKSNKGSTSANLFDDVIQVFKEKKENGPQKADKIMSKILKHAETQILKSEKLITPDGKPNIDGIKNLFQKFDSDKDKTITTSELEQLISTVKFGDSKPKYKDVVKDLFKDFDKDGNTVIDEPEFVEGISKWVNKAIRVANTPDRTTSIDLFDKIVWREAIYNKWALMTSLFQVILGIVILTFLGGPLMVSILQLSYSMSIPSFSISFVIVPLAMNARAAITALLPASQKSERSASLTFSEMYGGVIMNNIAGLTTLLAIVYAKGLTWNFSAEVLTVLVVCAVIGLLAYRCNTYPLWTCVLAFFLYPFSLGLCYFVQVYLHWN